MKITALFEGEKELENKIARMVDAMGYDKVEDILFEQAEFMAGRIEDKAPKGPRGRLRRSIVAKKLARSRVPVVIAGVDRWMARHAWLVEFGGHDERVPKDKKALKTPWGPRASVARMPPRPFFRPAVHENQGKIMENLEHNFKKAIEKGAR